MVDWKEINNEEGKIEEREREERERKDKFFVFWCFEFSKLEFIVVSIFQKKVSFFRGSKSYFRF